MKVALFKNIELDVECVSNDSLDGIDQYLRLSEYVDVEFVMLKDDELVKKQVDHINNQIEALKNDMTNKINLLESRKQELLALPDLTGE